jgi:hypothetical protein
MPKLARIAEMDYFRVLKTTTEKAHKDVETLTNFSIYIFQL